LSLLLLLGAIRSARADSEPIRIEYRAAAGCPDAAEFQRQVFERTASARLADDVEPARVFSVELQRRGPRVSGSLTIRERDGVTVARRVAGKDCSEVAMVLALATALAVDPRAELAPDESLDAEDGTGDVEPAPGVEVATGNEPPASPPNPVEVAPARDAPDPDLVPTPSFFSGGEPSWAFSGGARVVTVLGTAGGGSLSFAALDAAQSPFVGLELAALLPADARVDGATARFRLLLARPTFCARALDASAAITLAACLALELGSVSGAGRNLPRALERERLWFAPELLLRLDVAVSSIVFLELDLGAQFPITRYHFVFEEPLTSIHQVPAVAGGAAGRVGVRF
jgi:hypothetical protein